LIDWYIDQRFKIKLKYIINEIIEGITTWA
jgi:hypothetical protein